MPLKENQCILNKVVYVKNDCENLQEAIIVSAPNTKNQTVIVELHGEDLRKVDLNSLYTQSAGSKILQSKFKKQAKLEKEFKEIEEKIKEKLIQARASLGEALSIAASDKMFDLNVSSVIYDEIVEIRNIIADLGYGWNS